jgi:hypothetical protein
MKRRRAFRRGTWLLVAGWILLTGLVVFTPVMADAVAERSRAEGAADARTDFDHGVLMLLGEEGMSAGAHDIGDGLVLEIVPHACAPDLDPAAYMAAYNGTMKQRILQVHGIDLDAMPEGAFSRAAD